MDFPEFHDTGIVRKRLVFKGRVQRIGFRYEARLVAQKLGLAGTVRNIEDGSVEAELQGGEEKIDCFIHTMKNISRIIITDYTVENIPVIKDDKTFIITE